MCMKTIFHAMADIIGQVFQKHQLKEIEKNGLKSKLMDNCTWGFRVSSYF
jgi:hypothetical protein